MRELVISSKGFLSPALFLRAVQRSGPTYHELAQEPPLRALPHPLSPLPSLAQLATLPAHPESVPINALVAIKGTPMEVGFSSFFLGCFLFLLSVLTPLPVGTAEHGRRPMGQPAERAGPEPEERPGLDRQRDLRSPGSRLV